jgi:DNA-binding transcriptional MerR regulator
LGLQGGTKQLGFTLKEIKELLEIHESAKTFAGGKRNSSPMNNPEVAVISLLSGAAVRFR